MKRPRALQRFLLIVVSVALVASCSHGGLAASQPSSVDSNGLLHEIDQLWVADTPVPAYGSVFNLESEPSLYATAWSIRLASKYRISIPTLDVHYLSGWLRAVVDDRDSHGMAPIESIRLANQALADLGQPAPRGAAGAIQNLRGPGGLYRFAPNLPESWGATNSAFDAMLAAGIAEPTDLTAITASQLPATTMNTSASAGQMLDQLIPQWQIADRLLPASERIPLRSKLDLNLTRLAQVIASFPPDGVSAYVAASIVQIGAANGLSVPITPALFASLARDDGMLSSSEGDPEPDPKTTYYAAMMGRPQPADLPAYLHRSAGLRGWRTDVNPPDPQSTFYAAAIVRALGGGLPEKQLASASATWLALGTKALATTPDVQSIKNSFFALELSDLIGLQPPQDFLTALYRAEPALANADVATALWGALAASRSGLPVIAALSAAVHGAVAKLNNATPTSEVALAWCAVRQLKTGELEPSLHALAVPWRLAAGFSARQGVSVADIGSTAIGNFAIGQSKGKQASAALLFEDSSGYWLASPRIHDGNVIDLRTLYLGLWLSGRLPTELLPVM